jgi:Protein of unknown function (DUF3175)
MPPRATTRSFGLQFRKTSCRNGAKIPPLPLKNRDIRRAKMAAARKSARRGVSGRKTASRHSAPSIRKRKTTARKASTRTTARKRTTKGSARGRTTARSSRRWSHQVTEHSDALDLQHGVFKQSSAKKIAASLKRSAEHSSRRKAGAYRSALSMLTFYINRAGKNLPKTQRDRLERAKAELKHQFGKN